MAVAVERRGHGLLPQEREQLTLARRDDRTVEHGRPAGPRRCGGAQPGRLTESPHPTAHGPARDGVNDGRGFHRGAVQRLPGGQLLFGTGIGVLAVDPARLPASPLPVPDLTPVITGLQIDAQRWPEGRLPQTIPMIAY